MRKQIFYFALCAMLFALSFPVEAQEGQQVPRIGYLFGPAAARDKSLLAAFQQGLQKLGYLEGKNIVIEQRYGKRPRLPTLVAELVRLKVDIIVTGGAGARAAKKATSTIPIVMTYSADPVGIGLVASLAHPGGNVTGLSDYHGDMVTKRLELLKEVVPSVSRVAVLLNPDSLSNRLMSKDIQAAAPALGVTVHLLEVKGSDDVDRAFATIRKERLGGFLQFFGLGAHRKQIVDLAAKNRVPAIYTHGGWMAAGGLMSYGSNWPDLFRRAAIYVDKILRGAKPAELPVEQPKRFKLVINLKAAKQIGLTIPPSLLYRATKVIK